MLTLISDAKIDIRDVFVSQITQQYLDSMRLVDELDMDSASEFLQMAATLLEIKSRALLPKPPKPEEEGELSPEEALILQLTEYKRYKELSARMQKLENEARALLTRLPEEFPLPPPTIELTGLTLDKLVRAFARVLARAEENSRQEAASRQEIRRDRFTVAGCMSRISRRVKQKGKLRFTELFAADYSKEEVITMFLALLELARLEQLLVEQEDAYGEIILSSTKN